MKSFVVELLVVLICLNGISYGQDFDNPLHTLEPLLKEWNSYIDAGKVAELEGIYAHQVVVYGTMMPRGECIAGKKAWFSKHLDYHQKIGSIYHVTSVSGNYRISFEKITVLEGKETSFEAYLDFAESSGGKWEIVAESDRVTDKNLARKAKAVRLTNRKYCFYTSGTRYNDIAIPARTEQAYNFTFKDGEITGSGSYYSHFSRTMYDLEIKGFVNEKKELELNIDYLGPMYPDDPKDILKYKMRWKFDGRSLRWLGGDMPDHTAMPLLYCN